MAIDFRGRGVSLAAAMVVVAWGVLLARPAVADDERFCWRSAGDVAVFTISGIPVQVEFVEAGGTSELVDTCVEGEIPHPVCVSRLAPLMQNLTNRHFRDSCRFDFNGDGGIGLDDLGLAITGTLSRMGDSCAE